MVMAIPDTAAVPAIPINIGAPMLVEKVEAPVCPGQNKLNQTKTYIVPLCFHLIQFVLANLNEVNLRGWLLFN